MSSAHIVDSYTFTASAKTVKFNDYGEIKLEGVKLITNITTGTIIYQFNDATKNGTVSNNILNLTYDTTGMSNSDKLMIIYEAPEARSIMSGIVTLLLSIFAFLKNPSWATKVNGQQLVKVSLDQQTVNISTVNAVTTVSTITNLNGINSLDSRWLIFNQWNQNYRLGLRDRIS